MAATYPNAIAVFSAKVDNTDVAYAAHINSLQEEVVALESVLGTLPAGNAGTIKARIAAIESSLVPSNHTHNYLSATNPNLTGYTAAEDAGSGNALDPRTANVFSRSITAARTFTFASGMSTDREYSMRVYLTWSTAGHLVTWPGGIKWPNGQAPTPDTAAGRTNIYDFATLDGGASWFGALVGRGMA